MHSSHASQDVVPASSSLRRGYRRHEPEGTLLVRLVQTYFASFLELAGELYSRALPRYVRDEFAAYLRCGILAHGFARALCKTCRASMLVAFSCKRRGVCPSCGARRAANTAANLVDRVFPDMPVRQWVLSVPFDLRLAMARSPALCAAIVRIFVGELTKLTVRLGEERGVRGGKTGAVAVLQHFGNRRSFCHLRTPTGYCSSGDGPSSEWCSEPPAVWVVAPRLSRRQRARWLRCGVAPAPRSPRQQRWVGLTT